ncbi:MAG: triose-phosphate isomerase [Armatimonadota bacterium]
MSSRPRIVIGNWKMNLGPESGRALIAKFVELAPSGVDVVFCVPAPLIAPVSGQGVEIGAQDVFWADSGAFTGFVSPALLVEMGVRTVLIGHSERRGRFGKVEVPPTTLPFFGETDETVNLKLKACARHGLRAVVCVGETLEERQAGKTDSVIREQVAQALEGVTGFDGLFAYEPVWAIGTGEVCGAEEAARVCAMIAKASGTRVLYGGSVSPKNAAELFAREEIAGGLVGGASLKAEDFVAVVRAAVM